MRILLAYILTIQILFSQVKDEFNILNRLIDSSFLPVRDFLVKDSIKSAQLKITSANNLATTLLKSRFLKFFNEDNFSTFKVESIVRKAEVRFPEIVSYPLFGEENIKREIELEITYFVVKDNLNLFTHNFYQIVSDTIPISMFRANESLQNLQVLPEVSFWRRSLEPVILTSLTGIIVYLFFIIRSK